MSNCLSASPSAAPGASRKRKAGADATSKPAHSTPADAMEISEPHSSYEDGEERKEPQKSHSVDSHRANAGDVAEVGEDESALSGGSTESEAEEIAASRKK